MRRMVAEVPGKRWLRCIIAHKRCYDDIAQADYAINCIRLYHGWAKNEDLSSYYCPHCNTYHVGHIIMSNGPITYNPSPNIAALGVALELMEEWTQSK